MSDDSFADQKWTLVQLTQEGGLMGVNSKGVIAGKPYHVWTPLPAAPYSCVNITVQAVNEQT